MSVVPSPPLRVFEENIASQCGEDGVLRRALEVIGDRDRWCVEAGAWDGRNASNTFALIQHEGYSGVLIECDSEHFSALQQTHAGRKDVFALQRLVGFEGIDVLDRILADTPIPANFDLLSIDIDGNDYHVWEALRDYRPKTVVIEFNPTIPNEVDFVQPRDMTAKQGSSLTAITRLARSKGYRLIHATAVNGIFVDEKYFELFGIHDDSPTALRADLSNVTWLFQAYDGHIHVAGLRRSRWHDVPFKLNQFQVVPRWLRGYPGDYSPNKHKAWRAWRALQWRRAVVRRRLRRAR